MIVAIHFYRILKIIVKKLLRIEPIVKQRLTTILEYHGNDYCGWSIVANSLNSHSIVVDVGLGEDIAFSQSLIEKYKLVVNGFDPTPKSIEYIRRINQDKFVLYEYGLGVEKGPTKFYLPNNEKHISGSIICEQHLGHHEIEVEMITMSDIFSILKCDRIDLLKLDIEGAEFELIKSQEFKDYSTKISMICIEFHHRWPSYGRSSTLQAVQILTALGFCCAWQNKSTNEEFLFVKTD